MKKIILSIILVFVLVSSAFAQIFLEEGKININAEPGNTVSGSITVHNTSDKPLDIKVYWQDFNYVSPYDGNKEFLAKGLGLASAADWVSFSPESFKLPPLSNQKISYSVKVPAAIHEGHYGVLFFENRPQAAVIEGKGVNIVTRVGSLFFIEPTDKDKKAVISDVAVSGSAIKAKIANKGNVILVAHAIYYVMTNDGMVSDRGELENIYLPPGKNTDVTIPLKASSGIQTLVLTLDLQEGDSVVKEITFSKDASGNYQITKISD
ncbi:MAG: hypothetical protein HQL26_01915 [Candidatus Omnitrophica bacterium]|nr:hypothetical protein [Candidatus Omnitrophota bacterium]